MTIMKWMVNERLAYLCPSSLALLLLLGASAVAQEAPKEPNWTEMLKKGLAGKESLDRRAAQQWLDTQVQQLLTGEDPKTVQALGSSLYTKLTGHYQSKDASREFRTGLAEIVAESFTRQYKPSADSAKPPHPLGAAMVLMMLRDFKQPSCLPGFKAALADPTPGPRLVAAEGIAGIREQLNDQEWAALVAELQKTAVKETSSVTLSRIYRALMVETANRADAVIPVLNGILDSRLASYEKELKRPAEADGELVAWLARRVEKMNNPAVRTGTLSRAARLLADSVDALANDPSDGEWQEPLERLIITVEPAVESLAKTIASNPNTALPKPSIRDALTTGGKARRKLMTDALGALIGTTGKPGALNQNPFNLPVGLDIQRTPRPATTSAPASGPAK
ncbi:MAG TPA: hypothetical protein PKY77_06235 [Phycisphaerae bacterium]|nr:hypothetical protein [Phycisphaerae bacterium]HRY69546.1 hypothetical protein [Phycisphaerae bacterium]HSA28150.1 hypothetical protein [Phycisphaerae bacterium]